MTPLTKLFVSPNLPNPFRGGLFLAPVQHLRRPSRISGRRFEVMHDVYNEEESVIAKYVPLTRPGFP